jgi:quercetin dioxygenase-like cupin family protein
MKVNRKHAIAAAVGVVAIGSLGPAALGSPPSGFTTTNLVKADLDKKVKVNSDGVKFRTKTRTDVLVQKIVFEAGGSSGWHHHPGMVIVAVQAGTVTVWDSDCNKKTYGPGHPNGSVFVESGDEPGQVTSAGGATSYATFVAPNANPPVFRIEDNPPPCAS